MIKKIIHFLKTRFSCGRNCFTCPYYERYCKEDLENEQLV